MLKDVWQEAKRRKMERYWPPNGFEIVARICEVRDIRDPHAPEGDKWMEQGVRYWGKGGTGAEHWRKIKVPGEEILRRRGEGGSSPVSWAQSDPRPGARCAQLEEEGEGVDSQSRQGGLGTRYSMAQWRRSHLSAQHVMVPGMCMGCMVDMHMWGRGGHILCEEEGEGIPHVRQGYVWLRRQWVWLQGGCHLPRPTLLYCLRQLKGGRGGLQVQEDH